MPSYRREFDIYREGEGYLGQKLSIVDVQVSPADTGSFDLDLYGQRTAQSQRHFFSSSRPGNRTKTSFSRSSGSGMSTTLNSLGLEYLYYRNDPMLATNAFTTYRHRPLRIKESNSRIQPSHPNQKKAGIAGVGHNSTKPGRSQCRPLE